MRRMQALLIMLVIGVIAGLGYVLWANQAYLKMRVTLLSENIWPETLTATAERMLKPQDTFKECAQCPQMIVLSAGEFMMGSKENENEKPVHRVVIEKPFAVSQFELTFDEWDACIAHAICSYNPGDQGWGRGKRPVINVSWDDAQKYVVWLSNKTGKTYRLLSEAEWEYAARAGSSTAYAWGDDIGIGRANCDGCGSQWDNKQTAPVGSFSANTFGLYDMHGNVWEWVQDCFVNNYDGAGADASPRTNGDCLRRVLRGGAWGTDPWNLRSTGRFGYSSRHIRGSTFGFRVARPLAY